MSKRKTGAYKQREASYSHFDLEQFTLDHSVIAFIGLDFGPELPCYKKVGMYLKRPVKPAHFKNCQYLCNGVKTNMSNGGYLSKIC